MSRKRKGRRLPGPRRPPRVAGAKMDDLVDAMDDMFPDEFVKQIAKETGFIKRERKIDPIAFLWVMILNYCVDAQQTLADSKRSYESTTGLTLSDGSWHARFTPELVEFLRRCVVHAIEYRSTCQTRRLGEKLSQFEDVLIQDSTIIRLHESFAKVWPAARSKKIAAGIKVSTLISAVSAGPNRVEIFAERKSEIKTLKLGRWVKGRVLLMDLGFYKHQALARIKENGGSFVTRMKKNVNPHIITSNIVHRGRSIDISGKKLREIEDQLQREYLDVMVEIEFKRRKYRGKSRKDTLEVRLVGVWNDDTEEYHFYLTDIGSDVLSAKDVSALYRCRWEIELVFKELKSKYALDQLKTSKTNVVRALVWNSILTLLVSREVHTVIKSKAPAGVKVARFTQLRWANAFTKNAPALLFSIMDRIYEDWNFIKSMELVMAVYESQALDPHVERNRPREEFWS